MFYAPIDIEVQKAVPTDIGRDSFLNLKDVMDNVM